MLDKRTPRSQNFKNYQLQQSHQQSFSNCDVLPQRSFDFALVDPLPANIYELLKATYLYLDATKSPICSTLLSAMLQFEQYAAISSITLASVVSCSIKYQLESQQSFNKLACQTPTTSVASSDILDASDISDASSTLQFSSISSSSTGNDDIYSLLDFSASQLESQCSLLEQQISLCEQFSSIKDNFSICEAHNLHLDEDLIRLTTAHSVLESDISRLQAENLKLSLQTQSSSDQERAALISSADTIWFHQQYQVLYDNAYHLHCGTFHARSTAHAFAYAAACSAWRTRFGNISPPSRSVDDYQCSIQKGGYFS